MKLLDVPQVRQSFDYDCGAKVLEAVLVYYGISAREDKIFRETGTSKAGTSPKKIQNVAKKNGLECTAKSMTIDELKTFIDKKIPVILALQAWSDKKNIDWETDWKDGHYVLAIGYDKDKIYFEDPANFVLTYLTYDELEDRWHDKSVNGKKYLQLGIAIYGAKPKFSGEKIIHMK